MAYRLFFKLLLQRLDAERAHALAARTMRLLLAVPLVSALLRRCLAVDRPETRVRTLGLTFPSPLCVAAGVDKDGSWFEDLGSIGFGCVEVGTVTALPQAGNPPPRIFRLVGDRALLNKMGFPNPGAETVAERLRARAGGVVVGVNVGKSMAVPLAEAGPDYRACVERLAPYADYLVINVSSPNTPGLRAMQSVERLRPLVAEVREALLVAGAGVPLLVKISPDADDREVDAIAELALSLSLDGVVAVNTTVDRAGLAGSYPRIAAVEGGGVSGAPLKPRALEVLERLHDKLGGRVVLISVGGIGTPEDVWQRVLAGATLVQVYTGFVYGGPMWPSRVNRALARRVRAAGKSSVQELVGTGRPGPRTQ